VILVDTSIWVDHFRVGHPVLAGLLDRAVVLGHPWVVGELALGHLKQRQQVVGLLSRLPQAQVATTVELAHFIDTHGLHGSGIGYVDAQLLAATRLTADARLWTGDKRLAAVAGGLGLDAVSSAPSSEL
jgi:predicted nucleic acid-binding protein